MSIKINFDSYRGHPSSVSKEKDVEMLSWHMTFDHVDVDVTGAQQAVVISIAYRDPVTKYTAEKPSGYLTRLVVPGTLPDSRVYDREEFIEQEGFHTWKFDSPIQDQGSSLSTIIS